MEEVRREVALEVGRRSVLTVLEVRFPGSVPADIPNRVLAETDPDVLRRWLRLAVTVETVEAFLSGMD
jgi:hypothetical protein